MAITIYGIKNFDTPKRVRGLGAEKSRSPGNDRAGVNFTSESANAYPTQIEFVISMNMSRTLLKR